MENNKNNEIEIICLASSSAGNCYLLGNGKGEYIMVECGMPYKEIISRTVKNGVEMGQIKGVVISHEHKDHALSFIEMTAFRPYIYKPTKSSHKLTEWCKVYSFKVSHDVDCWGFIFFINDSSSVLFITDTRAIEFDENHPIYKYSFDHIMIECNHDEKQLWAMHDTAERDGNMAKAYKFERQAHYHLGIYHLNEMLGKMNLTNTQSIMLLHLSKDCANDVKMKTFIEEQHKKPTFVCYRNGGIN